MQDMYVFIDTCKDALEKTYGYNRVALKMDEGFIRRSEELWRAGHTGVQAAKIMHDERVGNV